MQINFSLLWYKNVFLFTICIDIKLIYYKNENMTKVEEIQYLMFLK